jgi:P27 family predicted phage terminase small subunit
MKRQRLAPNDLQAAGRQLWRRISSEFEVRGTEDLLQELCRLADRLAEVRSVLKAEGLVVGVGDKQRRHPLADLEPKLSAQYQKVWRLLGLADSDQPRRPVGRPSESDRL